MRVIIFGCNNEEKIINHFVKQGFFEFIVFNRSDTKAERELLEIDGISITFLNSFLCESSIDKLLKIKGSLNERFFAVYSNDIVCFDINQIIKKHKDSQKAVTLVEYNKRLCAALLESEAVDYFYGAKSFEKEVLLKIGEEQELEIY